MFSATTFSFLTYGFEPLALGAIEGAFESLGAIEGAFELLGAIEGAFEQKKDCKKSEHFYEEENDSTQFEKKSDLREQTLIYLCLFGEGLADGSFPFHYDRQEFLRRHSLRVYLPWEILYPWLEQELD